MSLDTKSGHSSAFLRSCGVGGADARPARDVADVLYLAAYVDRLLASAEKQPQPQEPQPSAPSDSQAKRPEPPTESDSSVSASEDQAASPNVDVSAPAPGSEQAEQSLRHRDLAFSASATAPLQVPEPIAVPDTRELAKALRPLNRRVRKGLATELDPDASAEATARNAGRLIIVKRPAERRWISLHVVFDSGRSMDFWKAAHRTLIRMFARQGAFHRLRFWTMSPHGAEVYPLADGNGSRSSGHLVPLTEDEIILVVSDTLGPHWRDGTALIRLREWGLSHPCALLHLFPSTMWKRTALADAVLCELSSVEPLEPNRTLRVTRRGRALLSEEPGIPVFNLRSLHVRSWARLLAGIGKSKIAGILPGRGAKEPESAAGSTPDQLLTAFMQSSSPEAGALLRSLAAAPLSPPVMRLIQAAWLPDSRHWHLAEVVFGGLLRLVELPDAVTRSRSEGMYFDFVLGVRERILDAMPRQHFLDVRKKASEYLVKLGFGDDEFELLLEQPESIPQSGGRGCALPVASLDAALFERLGERYQGVASRLRRLAGLERDGVGDAVSDEVSPASGRREPFVNSIGMTMLGIPSGTFTMGSPADESGRDNDDFPQHEVTLSHPFWITQTPVTQKQWKDVMGTTVAQQEAKGDAYGEVTGTGEDHPVYFVNWEEALRFCDRLTERENRRAEGLAYSLPTEAQWEYTCRAGTNGSQNVPGIEFTELGWFRDNSEQTTHPVGTKTPNAWGLHDCHGNVWEWCADWFERSTSTVPITEPQGPPNGEYRVVRGGGWDHDAQGCRSAFRVYDVPGGRFDYIGFRPVLSLVRQREAQGALPPEPEVQEEAARSVRPHFVPIKAGTFLMGSPGTEDGRLDREDPHQVTLTRDFEIADAPVTQAQYEAVMGTNPSRFKESGPDAPVEQVSWHDAVAFCDKLTAEDPNWIYRLPTEAEWEYACRAGTTGSYNVGNADPAALGWFRANSRGKTHPVREKAANPWGLYDCHGNVWEWCQDWFAENLGAKALRDPQGPDYGVLRVLRGSSWYNDNAMNRRGFDPGSRSDGFGFRPVRLKRIAEGNAPEPVPTQEAKVKAGARSAEWTARDFEVPVAPGMKMLCIGAGNFLMGEGTEAHPVTLTEDFFIAETPVTQAQYDAVMGKNPSRFKEVGPDAPVEQLTWDDAVAFCQRLSAADPVWMYRLPTEAEWEYACRAGTTGDFNLDGADLADLGWFKANSGQTTHPVRQKLPNAFGLYDCHGNVREWCADWYLETLGTESATDPQGPADGVDRVARGGGWNYHEGACRSASRREGTPDLRDDQIGFRPVRVKRAVDIDTGVAPKGRSPDLLARDFVVAAAPGMKMLCLGAGNFLMGEGSEAHPVTLTEDFFIAETPVTQAHYEAVMGTNPSYFKEARADAPVETVSWDDAVAFCAKLNQIAEPEHGWEWALPSEAQWEYACRAGTTTAYSWGDEFVEGKANVENDEGTSEDKEVAYFRSRGLPVKSTMPVRTFDPNPWGLYDCHGNVWEWCADWHGEYPKEAVVDPQGPESGGYRVQRGGSWRDSALICRSAYRSRPVPGIRFHDFGFRPVLTRKKQAEGTEPEPVPTQEAEVKAGARSRPEDYVAADFVNGLEMGMVCVPPGMFTMGSPVGERGRESESWMAKETQHQVTLTEPFWIAKTPVTQDAWQTLMGSTVAEQKAKGNAFGEVTGTGDDHPAYFVNWEDALAACDRLSIRERDAGRLPDGYLYTLPTEAQWEYACRAGTEGPFNVDGTSHQDLGWYRDNSEGSTHSVAERAPNAWGLYDCHGNVWEWCSDLLQEDLGAKSATDPQGPTSGYERVLRGGSWSNYALRCRSAYRLGGIPSFRKGDIGFRPVLCPRKQRTDLSVLPTELEAVAQPEPQAPTAAGQIRQVFVPIRPGKFLMGSPRNEKDREPGDAKETQHEVTLTHAFEIADAPVTQAQYEAVVGTNPSRFKESGSDAPVDQVSWEDAMEWCRKMSETDPHFEYRLPSEAEWEYVCRAGTTTAFHFGNTLNGNEANCDGNFPYGIGESGPFLRRTSPVRRYAPNAWGVYDCHGNVLEWCQDWYQQNLGAQPVMDPQGPANSFARVVRGGSWRHSAKLCRSAERDGYGPESRDDSIGFRPVRMKKTEGSDLDDVAPTKPQDSTSAGLRSPDFIPLQDENLLRSQRTGRDRVDAVLRAAAKPDEPSLSTDGPRRSLSFVSVPPGKFLMGSPRSERGHSDDEAQYEVTFYLGFEICVTQITQAQYESVTGTNPSHFKKSGSDAPVEMVSWHDANEWCRRMSAIDVDYFYRLPTEAEWEYACRAGAKGAFNVDSATLDELAYYSENSGGRTHPVGEKRSNAWGLHDCHGNVWEWCADWYGNRLRTPANLSPELPSHGEDRVLRGGAWDGVAQNCRSANRFRNIPIIRASNIGFRPVRTKKHLITEPAAVAQPEPQAGARSPRRGWFGGMSGGKR